MPRVSLPLGRPQGRIACPRCGNDQEFVEVAEDVRVTTGYRQNKDGSFTLQAEEAEVRGGLFLYCGICGHDMSKHHGHLQGMLF